MEDIKYNEIIFAHLKRYPADNFRILIKWRGENKIYVEFLDSYPNYIGYYKYWVKNEFLGIYELNKK